MNEGGLGANGVFDSPLCATGFYHWPTGLVRFQRVNEVGGTDDGDALVAFESEKIFIAGDDEMRFPLDRASENMIIIRIVGHNGRNVFGIDEG